jgi:hypothetical protein
MSAARTLKTAFAVAVALSLAGCHFGRATRSDPAYLRSNHAGSVQMSSNRPAKEVFERMAADARACYVGGAISSVMPAGGGIFVPITGPGRDVEAKFDDASHGGFVRAFVDGNIYLPMFQIDVDETTQGTRVDVYYAKDVSMQRAVPENVRAWLAGDEAACSFTSSRQH